MKTLLSLLLITCFCTTICAQVFYTEEGQKFPAFQIQDIEGHLVTNEKLKGKPSLLIFFGTRCPPCLKELSELNKMLPKSYYDTFNIYAIGSTDDQARLILFNFKKNYRFSYLPDPEQALFNQIGDHTIPRTFLLDKETRIISQTVGFNKTPFQNLLKNMRKMASAR